MRVAGHRRTGRGVLAHGATFDVFHTLDADGDGACGGADPAWRTTIGPVVSNQSIYGWPDEPVDADGCDGF